MIDQISLFEPLEYPDINDIPEEEAVRIVADAIGVKFTKNRFGQFEGKKAKLFMTLEYDRFAIGDCELFLGTGYRYGTESGGAPTGGIEEAIRYFRRRMERYGVA